MIQALSEIVDREKDLVIHSTNPNEKVNILYNLIIIKNKNGNKDEIYIDIKNLINNYLEVIKINNFGYDLLSSERLLKIINLLKLNEQIAILNYLYSTLLREFPELEKAWIQDAIKQVKIKKILREKKYWHFPKAFLLYSSLNFYKLIMVLALFVFFVFIILLPAPLPRMEIFNVKYANYSNNFFLNHLFNTLSIFGDIKNGCEVIASSYVGLLVQIGGKILFLLLIVNFIYKKLSDKISLK